MSTLNWLPSLAKYELLSRTCLMVRRRSTYPEQSAGEGRPPKEVVVWAEAPSAEERNHAMENSR